MLRGVRPPTSGPDVGDTGDCEIAPSALCEGTGFALVDTVGSGGGKYGCIGVGGAARLLLLLLAVLLVGEREAGRVARGMGGGLAIPTERSGTPVPTPAPPVNDGPLVGGRGGLLSFEYESTSKS
jgi:hypothetical protein